MEVSMDELRALVAQSILSTEAFKEQLAASQEAADRREAASQEAADRREAEAERRAAEYAAREAASKAEADRREAEAERRAAEYAAREAASKAEADKRAAEADKTMEDLKRQIKANGEQIGGLGNKFGSFTEGLALPSVESLLFEHFGIDEFYKRWKRRVGDKRIEIDGLGLVNGERNEGYVVEVKSHLDMRAITQVLELMANIRSYFPAFAEKRFYAIIAAADIHEDAYRAAVKQGLYVVGFADELMDFSMPADFVPKAF
jgi:chemotaxis protein histidine kinase CheA